MAYFRNKQSTQAAETHPQPVSVVVDQLFEDRLDREPQPEAQVAQQTEPEPPLPEPQQEPAPTPEAQAAQPEAPPQESDDSGVLRSQIEAQRRADEIQRQRQAMADADQRRLSWLQATPAAQANYRELAGLHRQAMSAGLADMSPEYLHFLESKLKEFEPQEQSGGEFMEAQPMPVERPAAPVAPAAAQPTPEFFQPPPVRMPGPSPVAVSAPVSRMIPSADRSFENPNSVRLSPAELEIAKASGISPQEYARGKLRMEREKRNGERQL